jgi:hypothetical protein
MHGRSLSYLTGTTSLLNDSFDSINIDQLIFTVTETDRFGVFQCMDTVAGFHPRSQIFAVRRSINQVHTSLI